MISRHLEAGLRFQWIKRQKIARDAKGRQKVYGICSETHQAAKSQQDNIEQACVGNIILNFGLMMMMDVYKILIFFILDTGCQKLFSSKRARPICAARWRKAEVLHIQGIIEVHAAHPLS